MGCPEHGYGRVSLQVQDTGITDKPFSRCEYYAYGTD